MTAFATYTDLATRLNRTFTAPEQTWVTALLEDAADYMRHEGMNGYQVYPSTQSTYIAYPAGGRVVLPQTFVRSIDAVTRVSDGVAISWTQEKESILVDADDTISVKYTYGLATPPPALVGINCAIAAQMMLTVSSGLGLNAAGLSSVSIDDYKAAFADGGVGTGMTMTAQTKQFLNDNYGRQIWVVKTGW